LRRLRNEIDILRRESEDVRNTLLKTVKEIQESFQQSAISLQEKIAALEKVIREKALLEAENGKLRRNVEDLVKENSRMVIDLYHAKV
jgi:cell division protein FtsB